jgi:hypothetical protein
LLDKGDDRARSAETTFTIWYVAFSASSDVVSRPKLNRTDERCRSAGTPIARRKQVSDSPQYRSKVRRNGQPGLGPLTMEARRMLLDELLHVQRQVGLPLISDHEIRLIQDCWGRDESTAVLRDLDHLVQLASTKGL